MSIRNEIHVTTQAIAGLLELFDDDLLGVFVQDEKDMTPVQVERLTDRFDEQLEYLRDQRRKLIHINANMREVA